ncbi:MAG: AAA family ATPase, partial [Pseudomonadota bacterium]
MDYIPTAFTGYANAVVIEGTGAVPYQFRPDVLLAVDVALNTGRPLLISGPPGCGKTSLARAIASGLNARYLSRTITSRTQIDDLFAEVDTLRRLADAQARMAGDPLLPAWAYLRPGLLWWAFDPLSADQRGARQEDLLAIVQAKGLGADTAAVSAEIGSPTNPTEGNTNGADVVVLLDEID